MKYEASLHAALFFLVGCLGRSPKMNEELPRRWPHAVTYEIFVQSFADSNGDGIGDIPGLISKLDYVQSLGVEAIWLMPINPSPSYHKYDVADYYDIHPDYGTLEDFRNLIKEAHRRDLKIVMDLVINHCSKLHPWFTSALSPDGEYRDFFVWKELAEIEAEGDLIKEKTGDSDNIHQWNELPSQDEQYFSFFWSGMPDLNYDNPKVREEVYKIGKFWLADIGVDGFRLDAAKHIYPDHRAEDNHAFWKEFKLTMESFKPEVYLVGEVWADLPTQAPFAQGFHALFNFDMAFSILETVKNEQVVGATIFEHAWKVNDDGSPVELYNESEEAFKQHNPEFINTTFLTNHDQNRVYSFLENDHQKARLAAAILFTLPGAPYIYYGEEIGMRGMKPDERIREPLIWSPESSETTSWIQPEYNTTVTLEPVSEQEQASSSLLNLYRKLIKFRRNSDILTYGELKPYNLNDDQLLAFTRMFDGKGLIVIHNLAGTTKKILHGNDYSTIELSTNSKATVKDKNLVLPAYSTVVLSQTQN